MPLLLVIRSCCSPESRDSHIHAYSGTKAVRIRVYERYVVNQRFTELTQTRCVADMPYISQLALYDTGLKKWSPDRDQETSQSSQRVLYEGLLPILSAMMAQDK